MQTLLIDFQDTVVDISWSHPGQMKDKRRIFLGRCMWRILLGNPLSINTAYYWSGGWWRFLLRSHGQSRTVISGDCTIASYGSGTFFSLQVLDTKDSLFIAFKATDHWHDGPLCLLSMLAVGTLGLLTESLLSNTHALWVHLPTILLKELL